MTVNPILVGIFAASIFVSGYVTYEIMSPVDYLNEKDQQSVEYIMKLACPELISEIKTHESKMEIDSVLKITKKCNRQLDAELEYVKSLEFEQALINEFSRHYKKR